jgi:hypothetical protein
MFERFRSQFRLLPDHQEPGAPWDSKGRLGAVAGYSELMAFAAGCTFENGLYRLHSAKTGPTGQENADSAFPEYAGRLAVFGFDWLGRQFAADFGRQEHSEPLVMMLEPGTGEALEIPTNFLAFHDEELVDYRNEALASEFFAAWSELHPDALPLDSSMCVGYRVPLFLGGSDTAENLEVTDVDVYWTFAGQMRVQAKGLPAGTPIRGIVTDE